MRHQKKFNHLGRKSAHRKAMLSNMAASLIIHKRIHTTVAKAKALRIFVEPLITKSKEDTTHSRRTVFSYLQSKEAVTELFREISKKIMDRPGGYTRILKTGNRFGDNAEMCLIELVDYNEAMLSVKDDGKGKATRRKRSGAKKKEGEGSEVKEAAKTVVEAKPKTVPEKAVEPVAEKEPEVLAEEGEEKTEA
ncbi:MAG: 50S ribosomal protein L17 [Bacteroidetes bacterium]|nr:50S ribosomal protein L17 [Bacteroidota bacterium]